MKNLLSHLAPADIMLDKFKYCALALVSARTLSIIPVYNVSPFVYSVYTLSETLGLMPYLALDLI